MTFNRKHMNQPIRIGTRRSPLAIRQAELVREALIHYDVRLAEFIEIVPMTTTGDKNLSQPLYDSGGKGLFTKEIEESLLAKKIDLAVHSLKDLPADLPSGLCLGATLPRDDPRDVLIAVQGQSLEDLPEGARVGTVSLRRRAQLLVKRPDLRIVHLRGNVETRLQKLDLGEMDAVVLAAAGLHRLKINDPRMDYLSENVMLPAVGQGIIATEIRQDDEFMHNLMAKINHHPTWIQAQAERAFLASLGASCRMPVGALAQIDADLPHVVKLTGMIAYPDGQPLFRYAQEGIEPGVLGQEVGETLLALVGPAFVESLQAWRDHL